MTSLPLTKQHPLLRLLHYAKNYRPQVWTAATFTILNTIFDLAPSYLIGVAVDVVVEKESSIIAHYPFPIPHAPFNLKSAISLNNVLYRSQGFQADKSPAMAFLVRHAEKY